MEKVCLIIPEFDVNNHLALKTILFPLETAYIDSILKKEGCKVLILDLNFQEDKTMLKDVFESFQPDWVGITATIYANWMYDQLKSIKDIAGISKQVNPKTNVVLSGIYATSFPEYMIGVDCIDYIILGESEYTYLNLCKGIRQEKIDGIVYKSNNGIKINPKIHFINRVDKLPFPNRDKIERYFNLAEKCNIRNPEKSRNFTQIITSRGCPMHCIFCNCFLYNGREYRARSPENVLAEMEEMINRWDIQEFHFWDENLTVNRDRCVKIFDEIVKRGWDIHWITAGGLAVYNIDEELLDKMKASGCYRILLSIESGTEKSLKKMKKPVDLKKARDIVNYIKKIGIEVASHFVIGFPWETKEDIMETINYAESLELDYTIFPIARPQPNTEFFKICEDQGLFTKDSSSSLTHWSECIIKTENFKPEEIEKIRVYEWDRINFSNDSKKKKIAKMMGVTLDELDMRREETKKRF